MIVCLYDFKSYHVMIVHEVQKILSIYLKMNILSTFQFKSDGTYKSIY